MYLQLLTVALVVYSPALAIAQNGTISSGSSPGCATGEARTKYESCSSDVASRLNGCKRQDYACACDLAASGFGCLTSYCPTHTEAVCSGSAVLNGLCSQFNQAAPITFTEYPCPTSLVEDVKALIQSSLNISSTAAHIHSSVGPTGQTQSAGLQSQQPQHTTSSADNHTPSNSILAPSKTGAAERFRVVRRSESDWGNAILAGGTVGALMVAGLAAYL